ncbi:MAG: hypothetical protein ACXVHV_04285 [Methanobacterium sp.]
MKSRINNHLKPLKNRIMISSVLIIVLFGLFIYYTDNFAFNELYPSSSAILKNYPIGKTVAIDGDFAGFYDGGFYIKDRSGLNIIYKINSSYRPVNGDIFSILGTLSISYTINPQEMVIVKQWKENFLLLRSGIIAIILILLFWRYWKFDFKTMEFIKRRK